MKLFRQILCALIAVSFVFALTACGETGATLTTENLENYFDIDYGVDVVEKTDEKPEEKVYITEGQFYVSAAKKNSSHKLRDVVITFQVTYILYEGTDREVTKTKQIEVEVNDLLGNNMEMFTDVCTSTEGYEKISIKSVTPSQVKGSIA